MKISRTLTVLVCAVIAVAAMVPAFAGAPFTTQVAQFVGGQPTLGTFCNAAFAEKWPVNSGQHVWYYPCILFSRIPAWARPIDLGTGSNPRIHGEQLAYVSEITRDKKTVNVIKVVDLNSMSETAIFGEGTSSNSQISWRQNGKSILFVREIMNPDGMRIDHLELTEHYLDTGVDKILKTYSTSNWIYDVEANSDGTWFYAGSSKGGVSLFAPGDQMLAGNSKLSCPRNVDPYTIVYVSGNLTTTNVMWRDFREADSVPLAKGGVAVDIATNTLRGTLAAITTVDSSGQWITTIYK